MDPVLLDNVIGTLFPRQDSYAGQPGPSSSTTFDDDDGVASTATEWSEKIRVTEEELLEATKRMASRDVAPGPDGIPGRVWAETMDTMTPRLRHLFTRCLKEGVYPRAWRTARLVDTRRPHTDRYVCWTRWANYWRE
jgi:hypothetical protein